MSGSTPDNFFGLEPRYSTYETSRFAVLPIPYDGTTSYSNGTREGPRAVLSASQQVELFDEGIARECYTAGVATLDAVEIDVSGPEATLKNVYKAALKPVRDGKFLLGVGGEHSITAPLVQAVATKHKKLSVLQIDAHADLRDDYQGSPHSHAAVMRRVHELGVPAVGVGIRNYSREEADFIRQAGKPIFPARVCRDSPSYVEAVLSELTERVYVTIDIDGFDPAFAPGTGTPEPGGLDWYHVTDLLAAVAQQRTIVAADVNEVRPIPPNTVTEFLAAKLLYRLIGLVTGRR